MRLSLAAAFSGVTVPIASALAQPLPVARALLTHCVALKRIDASGSRTERSIPLLVSGWGSDRLLLLADAGGAAYGDRAEAARPVQTRRLVAPRLGEAASQACPGEHVESQRIPSHSSRTVDPEPRSERPARGEAGPFSAGAGASRSGSGPRVRVRTVLGVLVAALCLAGPIQPVAARDRGGDGKFERRGSAHFVLLQDVRFDSRGASQAEDRFERDVLAVLESAYRVMSDTLGLRPPSDVVVRVYDARFFDQQFAQLFGFRAAGFFDGSIHVRGGPAVDARLVRVLHHEYVHAVIDAAGGTLSFPTWLNEGMAEYFESLAVGKRGLSFGERAVLARAAAQGAWISLAAMSRPFAMAHLSDQQAGIAYLQSFAAVDHLVRREGMSDFRRFCERTLQSRSVERSLARTYRVRSPELEQQLIAELLP